MKKTPLFALLLLLTAFSRAQTSPETAIRKVMADQAAAWNKGDLDEFMKGYWRSDSVLFIGHSVTHGYDSTLAHYKAAYGTPDKMGVLTFPWLTVKRLSSEYCFVVGKFQLRRKAGDVSGMYTLLFRKINGQWVIVVDHSSSD
jgi:uncharacterized protein (TIGR02246 family)